MSNICTPYYDNQYPVFTRQSGGVATNIAIQHPNVYYYQFTDSWSSTNSPEFWNKGNGDIIKKTIYSPSLSNYSEPKSNAFTGFTTTGSVSYTYSEFNINGSFSQGWNFYCQPKYTGSIIRFDALGYRDVYNVRQTSATAGSVIYYGQEGDYWSLTPKLSNVSYSLYFGANFVYTYVDSAFAYGLSIRSILE